MLLSVAELCATANILLTNSPDGDLETVGFVAALVIQRLGVTHGERADGRQPVEGQAGRVAQFGQVDGFVEVFAHAVVAGAGALVVDSGKRGQSELLL